mmetsp:Transcript_38381/g.68582  ORF Transcript_38381/g.68582 Transcript_38381/m.68582 type:complete len:316 (+) Transcript_38381:2816-3763(+)
MLSLGTVGGFELQLLPLAPRSPFAWARLVAFAPRLGAVVCHLDQGSGAAVAVHPLHPPEHPLGQDGADNPQRAEGPDGPQHPEGEHAVEVAPNAEEAVHHPAVWHPRGEVQLHLEKCPQVVGGDITDEEVAHHSRDLQLVDEDLHGDRHLHGEHGPVDRGHHQHHDHEDEQEEAHQQQHHWAGAAFGAHMVPVHAVALVAHVAEGPGVVAPLPTGGRAVAPLACVGMVARVRDVDVLAGPPVTVENLHMAVPRAHCPCRALLADQPTWGDELGLGTGLDDQGLRPESRQLRHCRAGGVCHLEVEAVGAAKAGQHC